MSTQFAGALSNKSIGLIVFGVVALAVIIGVGIYMYSRSSTTTAPVATTTPTSGTTAPAATGTATTTGTPATTTASSATPTTAGAPAATVPASGSSLYEGKIVKCATDDGIFFVHNGKKRHFTPAGWGIVSGNPKSDTSITMIPCADLTAMADGDVLDTADQVATAAIPAATIVDVPGNNGSANELVFCSGIWGRDVLKPKYEALGFNGASGDPMSLCPGGTCHCKLTKDDAASVWPVTISGNNGAVDCNTFCAGPWGRYQMETVWGGKGYSGALNAGLSNSASAAGTCECRPNKSGSWGK